MRLDKQFATLTPLLFYIVLTDTVEKAYTSLNPASFQYENHPTSLLPWCEMKDADKTKEQLIKELEALRAQAAETARLEAGHKGSEGTDRGPAEQGEGEESYRDLYEEAPNVYLSIGTDGRIIRANHRAADPAGRFYRLKSLLFLSVHEFLLSLLSESRSFSHNFHSAE